MTVRVSIPGPLRPLAAGRDNVTVAAAPTVGDVLGRVFSAHPGLRDRVLTETGEVRPHVNVFVEAESIRFTGGLSTPVADGATIAIIPAVSGGA